MMMLQPVIGRLAAYLSDKVLPSLFGTLVGAGSAIFLKSRQDRAEDDKRKIIAVNYSLFLLIQQLRELIDIESFLSPWRPEDRKITRWYELQGVMGKTELLPLHPENLDWTLHSDHPEVLGNIMIARNTYLTVLELIEFRNKVKTELHVFLENEDIFVPPGAAGSALLNQKLSDKLKHELVHSAEELLKMNMKSIHRHFKTITEIRTEARKRWPKERFSNIEISPSEAGKLGISVYDANGNELTESTQSIPDVNVYRFEVN